MLPSLANQRRPENDCAGKSATDAATRSTGSMIVVRVTKETVGDELTRVLQSFLSHTADYASRWKHAEGWQLFDVIGDFAKSAGAGESKHLATKISKWTLNRCGRTLHALLQESSPMSASLTGLLSQPSVVDAAGTLHNFVGRNIASLFKTRVGFQSGLLIQIH